MKNKKGFTLPELLIVVAMIGVLVAISIPVFTGQLEKARVATDRANVRSGKAVAVAQYLTDGALNDITYVYDASRGTVVPEGTTVTGYGKSNHPDVDGTITGASTESGIAPKGGYVSITVKMDGEIIANWHGGSTSSAGKNSSSIENSAGNNGSTNSGINKVVNDLTVIGGNSWQSYIDTNKYNAWIEPGTLVTDQGHTYLFYGNQNGYYPDTNPTVVSLMNNYPNNILELNSEITIVENKDFIKHEDGEIAGGTIWFYKGKYYTAKQTITVDLNEEARNPSNDNRWVMIAGQ